MLFSWSQAWFVNGIIALDGYGVFFKCVWSAAVSETSRSTLLAAKVSKWFRRCG